MKIFVKEVKSWVTNNHDTEIQYGMSPKFTP
jgi:hypothetical protein